MAMVEWTEQQLRARILLSAERQFVYFYTPLCGTCKMTERMLQIILTMMPNLPIVKSNVNFCPQLVQSWKIESVPCIVRLEQYGIADRRYRMQGVDDLHRWFQEALAR
jgi:thioredoxin-like negative regulator of GroEL